MPKFIDRDKALSFPLANGKYDHEHANEHFIYGLETYKEWLEQLPTLSPDEVRGVVKVNYEHGDYSCSACGHPARRLSFARKKYCDECGAKLLWEVSEDA